MGICQFIDRSPFVYGTFHVSSAGRCVATHVEFNDPKSIIPIIMFPQIRLHSRDPNRRHALDLRLLSKKPQRQVDVVNGAVDEDPARELGVGDEESRRVQLVACLRAEGGGGPDVSAGYARVRVAV